MALSWLEKVYIIVLKIATDAEASVTSAGFIVVSSQTFSQSRTPCEQGFCG